MDIITYALAKKYADKAIAGLGTIKGQDVIVKSITKEDGVSTVTFEWLGSSGATETAQMIVADGAKGDPGEKGDPGTKGDPGEKGDPGLTSYFHVKYSDNATPQTSSELLDTPADYIGTYSDFNSEASTDPADYTWTRFKGEQGEQGDPGAAAPRPSFTIDDKKHLIVSYDDGTTEDLGLMPSTDVELSTEEDNVLILKDGKLYVPKTDLSDKLDKKNPVATGSFSLGRANSSKIGSQSLAIGDNTTASGAASSALGSYTIASGDFAHAEGGESEATGDVAHAEGIGSVASGYASHAEGEYTIAASEAQHVEGQFNIEDKANKYAHIIGGGSSTSDRKNIHTVDWEGNAFYAGDAVANNISLVTTEKRLSNNGYNSISGSRNLLNSSLQTSGSNGVTCTNNGDGTYTLNGTNNTSNNITFPFKVNIPLSQKVKLIGCPKFDDNGTGMLQTQYNGSWGSSSTWDKGSGALLEDCSLISQLAILIYPNAVLENVIFKPMITTDLNATYDDYEPYFESNKVLTDEVKQKADKSDIITNLLCPTLNTQTKNGVTCTNNGDGTYTVTGTATAATYFIVQDVTSIAKSFVNKTLYLAGCTEGSTSTYDLRYEINSSLANGGCYTVTSETNGIAYNNQITLAEITSASVVINVRKNAILDNVVFKPILSTSSTINYNNFITYTGDTGNLSKDIAEIKKKTYVTEKEAFSNSNSTLVSHKINDSDSVSMSFYSNDPSILQINIIAQTVPCPILITNKDIIKILKENNCLNATFISKTDTSDSTVYYKGLFSNVGEEVVYLDICKIDTSNRTYSIPASRGGLGITFIKTF